MSRPNSHREYELMSRDDIMGGQPLKLTKEEGGWLPLVVIASISLTLIGAAWLVMHAIVLPLPGHRILCTNEFNSGNLRVVEHPNAILCWGETESYFVDTQQLELEVNFQLHDGLNGMVEVAVAYDLRGDSADETQAWIQAHRAKKSLEWSVRITIREYFRRIPAYQFRRDPKMETLQASERILTYVNRDLEREGLTSLRIRSFLMHRPELRETYPENQPSIYL